MSGLGQRLDLLDHCVAGENIHSTVFVRQLNPFVKTKCIYKPKFDFRKNISFYFSICALLLEIVYREFTHDLNAFCAISVRYCEPANLMSSTTPRVASAAAALRLEPIATLMSTRPPFVNHFPSFAEVPLCKIRWSSLNSVNPAKQPQTL